MTDKELKTKITTGTVKDIALLLIEDRVQARQGCAILTDEQITKIYNSVKHNKAEADELNGYLTIASKFEEQCGTWQAMLSFIQLCVMHLNQYAILLEQAKADALIQGLIDRLLNIATTAAKNDRVQLDTEVTRFTNVLMKYGEYIKFDKDDDGTYSVNYEHTLQYVRGLKVYDVLLGTLSNLKSLLQVIDEYLTKTNGYEFVPSDVQDIIAKMQLDFAVSPNFSRQVMYDLRKQKKYKQAKEQECRAIYPCLDDVDIDKDQIRQGRELFDLL